MSEDCRKEAEEIEKKYSIFLSGTRYTIDGFIEEVTQALASREKQGWNKAIEKSAEIAKNFPGFVSSPSGFTSAITQQNIDRHNRIAIAIEKMRKP